MARLVALIAFLVAALAAPATGAATEPDFCDRTIVFQVPWLRSDEPEPDGRLGFGPSSIRMRVLPRLTAPGGRVGFELFLHPRAKTAHPRWKVKANLARLYPRKNFQVFLGSKERRLPTIDADQRLPFVFEVDERPAYYAVRATFTSLDGRELGHFRLHFKAIPPTRDARLALDDGPYRPGQTVFGRIENHGTAPVTYGAPYRIERFDAGAWSLAPESPDAFILPLYFAMPGESGSECSPFPIPASMAPGHYRMVKDVSFGGRSDRIEIGVSAEFNVVP